VQDPTAGVTSARERVLEVVPGLDELLERGAPGDQVQSQALAAGAAEQAWLLWFVRRRDGLVIIAPLAGIRPDAVPEALARCNEHNAAMEWSVLSVAPWEGGQVASLSVRLALPPRPDDVWAMVGGSMQHVLEAAGPARERLSDLIED
jgi:hypothetical protein